MGENHIITDLFIGALIIEVTIASICQHMGIGITAGLDSSVSRPGPTNPITVLTYLFNALSFNLVNSTNIPAGVSLVLWACTLVIFLQLALWVMKVIEIGLSFIP